MVRRHMAKKAAKKSSASRRVTARPLGFWQFIRKNLLIIAGLLLLPVTVGAVVSSYNYANQSSAATLKTQNNIYRGNSKKATLKTQDAAPASFCTTVANNGGRWCGSNVDECQTCVCTGNLTDRDPSNDACGWAVCIVRHQLECGYITPIPPTVGPKSCTAGNGGSVADGNYGWFKLGTDCRFCHEGVWEGGINITDISACGGVPPTTAPGDTPAPIPTTAGYTPPPRQEPTSVQAQTREWEYGNDCYKYGPSCEFRHNDACKDKGGWARDKDNDLPSDCSSRGGIPCPGGFCKGGVGVNSAFDVGKAIKNFFGIFGF